jgi:hypothetical protein
MAVHQLAQAIAAGAGTPDADAPGAAESGAAQ